MTNVELDKIKIYPNPTTDRLFINTNLNDYKINIYNTLGEKIYQSINNSKNSSLAQAALSHRALMNRLASQGRWEPDLES